jgi:hypothetical protein
VRRLRHAAPRIDIPEPPPWRTEAVQRLFSTYLSEFSTPESANGGGAVGEQAVARRRAREWTRVFERLAACGVWEILFPTEERADSDHVSEIAERFLESGLVLDEVRADGRRVQRIAREIRREVDALMDEGSAES